VYLLGLLSHHAGDLERLDLERLKAVVSALGHFATPQSARALAGEFRREKSSNTTRAYLNEVLAALRRLPREIAKPVLTELAHDKTLTQRMRKKFSEAAWDIE
jgi:hypothetical protein